VSPNSKRVYAQGLDAFFTWRSEVGNSALDTATVQEFRTALQERQLSSSTIGVYLSAVRRLAMVAAETGFLEPQIANSISKVPGIRSKGVRPATWLTADEAGLLLQTPDSSTLKGCRDRAVFALLLGCALRRTELTCISLSSFQMREGRWVLLNFGRNGKRLHGVPVPKWVKRFVDVWVSTAGIIEGRIFRRVNKGGVLSQKGISDDTVWTLTREYGARIGKPRLSPDDLRRTCAKLCRASGGSLEQIQVFLGHASVQTTERYVGTRESLDGAVNDNLLIPLAGTASELSRKGPQRAWADRSFSSVADHARSSR
jgi:integrase